MISSYSTSRDPSFELSSGSDADDEVVRVVEEGAVESSTAIPRLNEKLSVLSSTLRSVAGFYGASNISDSCKSPVNNSEAQKLINQQR